MTPDEYIEQLDRLLCEGKDREAQDFAARVQPTLDPPLSVEQLDLVSGGLEGAAMMVAMLEWEGREQVAEPLPARSPA